MKFKKGKLVEVLRREHESCGSWFPAIVVSARGNYCKIRYESLSDNNGGPVMEKVHKEDVRPRPPHKKRKRWIVGDAAEIFDFQCWREGKIAKVLKNNLFVVRLFGSIQLKEFHESNIRIQQAWRSNNWSVIGKVFFFPAYALVFY
jgi:hypothetical protein